MKRFIAAALLLWTLVTHGASPVFQDFNTSQFDVTGNKVAVKSGALQTNGVFKTSLTLDGNNVLTNAPGSGITNSGTGTVNTLAKWTGMNSLGTSAVFEDGTNLFIGEALQFAFDITNGFVAFGTTSFNPDAGMTFNLVSGSAPFNAIALNDARGPYISAATSVEGDIVILGLDSEAGNTRSTQRISTGQGSTGGYTLQIRNQVGLDGDGGNVQIYAAAGSGADHNGGNLDLRGGNPTGTGTAGNITLTAGNGGVIEAISSLLLDTVSVSTLLQADANQTVASIANAVGILTNDGSGGFGFTTNVTQAVTYNNITTTNLTVINALTVSNIITTNITVQNNLTTSNFFTVNGNHNTVIITNALTLQTIKTNVLGTTSTGLLTNINYGSGLTWTPSTLTLSATATSETTATNIVTLTMTGTNVSAMDYSLVQRGGVFKLVLTGNGYIGAPSGVANTSFTKAWLMVQQPSTGTCTLTFTNGFYAFSEGVAPVIDTNNGAVSVFEFASDVFTNGLLHGSLSTPSKLIP